MQSRTPLGYASYNKSQSQIACPGQHRLGHALYSSSGEYSKRSRPNEFEEAHTEQSRPKGFWIDLTELKNVHFLPHAPDLQQRDLSILFPLVKANGMNLKYMKRHGMYNRDLVIAAVKQNPLALQFACEDLQKEPYIVCLAVQKNGMALEFASEGLKGDEKVVLAAVKQNGLALKFAGGFLKRFNETVVLEAVKQNGMALEFVYNDLKRNKEVVDAAINQNAKAEQFALHGLPLINSIYDYMQD